MSHAPPAHSAHAFKAADSHCAERVRASFARQGAMRLIGAEFVAEGFVAKPGRTLAVTRGEVHAERGGKRTLVALMQQTLMVMHGKADA